LLDPRHAADDDDDDVSGCRLLLMYWGARWWWWWWWWWWWCEVWCRCVMGDSMSSLYPMFYTRHPSCCVSKLIYAMAVILMTQYHKPARSSRSLDSHFLSVTRIDLPSLPIWRTATLETAL